MNKNEIADILRAPDNHALYAQADVIRQEWCGSEVWIRGLLEFSNVCVRNCCYCGLRRDNQEVSRFQIPCETVQEHVTSAVEDGFGIQNYYLQNDGRGADVIKFLAGGSRYPATSETLAKNMHRFEMHGKKVWDFAVKVLPLSIKKVIEEAGKTVQDIDLIISHQANINIIKTSMNELGLSMEKTYTNMDRYGNTSGASIPIALSEAHQRGLLKKGDNVVLVGFGGGLSYGAVYLKWAL